MVGLWQVNNGVWKSYGSTLLTQTKYNSFVLCIFWEPLCYFTRNCSKTADLTLEWNGENYGELLSLSIANICRINELAVYNLFPTLAKLVLFRLSWETTGAWIIPADLACFFMQTSLPRTGFTHWNAMRSNWRPIKHHCTLGAGVSCPVRVQEPQCIWGIASRKWPLQCIFRA